MIRKNSSRVLPLYLQSRSPKRDSTTVIWPFFSWIDDRGKKYHEWQGPWPFVIFARGEGKTTSRVWPLFSQSHNNELESDSYLWPLYTFQAHAFRPAGLRAHAHFVLSVLKTRWKKTRRPAQKSGAWICGRFSPGTAISTATTACKSSRRLKPPCRTTVASSATGRRCGRSGAAENNPRTGASSQSFLWNLYRHETHARLLKNARSCSAFSSINLMRNEKAAAVLHSGVQNASPLRQTGRIITHSIYV